MHLQTAAKYLKYKRGDFPVAEEMANTSLSLPVHEFIKNSDNSISAILDGKIVNSKGKQAIGYGEIVKTQTLKKLSTRFKIHKNIILMKVTKKK